MKRLLAILFAALMVFSLCACSKNEDNSDTTETVTTVPSVTKGDGTTVIVKKDIPDPDMLGAWKADSEDAPYIIFTDTSKVRIVRGAQFLESEVAYGEDGLGNKSIATDCSEFKGQSVYTIKDGVLTIVHPVLDDNGEVKDYENLTFKAAVDYKPLLIEPKEGFKADDALVGLWTNELTGEAYEFTNDGILIMTVENFNGNVETFVAQATYTVENGNVTVYSIVDGDYNEISQSGEYYIEGTKLMFMNSDYYLNGEGDPNAAHIAE